MQSGKPAASGGFVELEVEPAALELLEPVVVLVPLMPLLLPVLGISLRTCLVTLSQHSPAAGEAVLGDVVVVLD